MKLGVQINRFTWPGEPQTIHNTLSKIAIALDKSGFYSAWVMDHFFQIHWIGSSDEPMLEAYTTLGYLAGLTKKIKLGTMVSGVIYRHPALLVKAVTTLDVLNNGRTYFGIGAAWNEEEARGLGFQFPPVKVRFELLEETLQIALKMWSDDNTPFKGTLFHLEKPMNHPQHISKPHPRILIGGGGEQKTLKLVAQYADACNLFDGPELPHKLAVLKKHCAAVGRDYNVIEKTVLSNGWSLTDKTEANKFIEHCKSLKELGFDHVITSIRDIETISSIDIYGELVVPQLNKI